MTAFSARRLWWVAVLVCAGCGEPPDAPAVDYARPIVLLVSPDSGEVSRLQRELGDDFYVIADDAMWYRAEALALLDSLRVPHAQVGRGAARFLVDGKPRVVSWEKAEQAWFAVVYDGRVEPAISADVDLARALATFSRDAR